VRRVPLAFYPAHLVVLYVKPSRDPVHA
jgi:hypothetical protein